MFALSAIFRVVVAAWSDLTPAVLEWPGLRVPHGPTFSAILFVVLLVVSLSIVSFRSLFFAHSVFYLSAACGLWCCCCRKFGFLLALSFGLAVFAFAFPLAVAAL